MYDSFIVEIYFITCPTLNHISCTKNELHYMGWTLTEKKLLQLQFHKTPEWELEMCSSNHKCLAGFFFYIYMLFHFLWYCIRLLDVILHTLQESRGEQTVYSFATAYIYLRFWFPMSHMYLLKFIFIIIWTTIDTFMYHE